MYFFIYLTGYHTGSVYYDLALKRNGFPGEYRMDGSVIVIKTHLMGDAMRKMRQFDQAVIVIRNPLDSMKAEWNRRKTGSHVRSMNGTTYAGKSKFY